MSVTHPVTSLDRRFSSQDATPVTWHQAEEILGNGEMFWLATVRPDGQPHVTPVAGVWCDGAFYFCTGPSEQKSINLASNPRCTVTIGSPQFRSGLDIVLEGQVEPVTDPERLGSIASSLEHKYDGFFGFSAGNGVLNNAAGGVANLYRIAPRKALGFGRGQTYSQTRWAFQT